MAEAEEQKKAAEDAMNAAIATREQLQAEQAQQAAAEAAAAEEALKEASTETTLPTLLVIPLKSPPINSLSSKC